MAALTLFPLQYKRQDAVPVDIDQTFATTADRIAYLTSPRRYAGMLVADLQENVAYLLNSARDTWIPIGAGGGGSITVQQDGVALGGTPTTVINFTGTGAVASTANDGATVTITEPIRYNATQDVIEYSSALQGRWIDIATPKVTTKVADYTLTSHDNQYIFRMDSTSPINLNIPDDGTENIPIGTTAVLSMNGTGATSFVPAPGVTVLTPSTLTIAMRYGKASITKTGANRWEVEGNIGGSTTINASGAPMGGFKVFTGVARNMPVGDNLIDVNLGFTSGNGFWYGLMDPDNPTFDWPHVKVIGGQVTLASTGSFFVSVSCDITVPQGSIRDTTLNGAYVGLSLRDGNGNQISIGSTPMVQHAPGDVSFPLTTDFGITTNGWVNNDGVSGPFGSNQTLVLHLINPYSGTVSIKNLDVCIWYADTRQPRAMTALVPPT